MFELFFAVSLKLFIELLVVVATIAAIIGILWIWDKISPKSFERALRKVARYFK